MNLNEEIHRIKEVMGISSQKTEQNYIGNEIENLVVEFYNQLEFQKKVFVSVSNSLSKSDKYNYIKKIEREQVNYLFSNDKVILESYEIIFPKFIISENTFNLLDEITKFNDFLFTSICNKVGFVKENLITWTKKQISEQRISDLPQNQGPKPNLAPKKSVSLYNQIPDSPSKQQFVKDQQALGKKIEAAKKPKAETDILTNAINYLKENGVGAIMEGLRSALLSIGGVAVQTVLAFTGVGTIANDAAWGILTLYDAYQYFINGGGGKYLMNLIIDIICLVTAGTLGSVLGKYIGKAAASVSEGIKILMEGGAGKFIKPVLEVIQMGAQTVSKFLGEAANFMLKNMGIGWAAKVIGNVKSLFKSIVNVIGSVIGKVAGKVSTLIQRKGVQLLDRYSSTMAEGFARLSAEQVEAWVGRTVTEAQLKAAEKLAEENLKNKPTQEVLDLIDKEFGTHMGDLFAIYLNSKKTASATKTIQSGNLDKITQSVGADVLQFKDPTEKIPKYTEKIQKATKELTGVN